MSWPDPETPNSEPPVPPEEPAGTPDAPTQPSDAAVQPPDAPARPSDAPARPSDTPAKSPDALAIPPGSGRARELSRVRKTRSKPAETGRKHHMGAAPELMPVWLPDGTITTTRTSAAQLADQTPAQLSRLRTRISAEMSAAAAEMDYEKAAHRRDEIAAVEAELGRRTP